MPRKLVDYLREVHQYEVEERWPGIYLVGGGETGGLQIVETKRLGEGDGGIWLRGLRPGLKREELGKILERGKGLPKGTPLSAYLWMVAGANREEVKEERWQMHLRKCWKSAGLQRNGKRGAVIKA